MKTTNDTLFCINGEDALKKAVEVVNTSLSSGHLTKTRLASNANKYSEIEQNIEMHIIISHEIYEIFA